MVIDEAQQLPSIGLNLKLIIDHIKDVTVLVTGSSSLFDLDQKLGEPLSGRKKTFKLFTIAQLELNAYLLKDILVYDGIKNANKIYKILQLLAYQVGKEVAFDELATHVSMSKNTVEKYLDLLEKNYIFYERMKFLQYNDVFVNRYFWRTYDQQEIDLVEERNQCLSAFEVKYSSKAKYKFSKYWLEHYPEAVNQVIHKEN